MAKGWAGWLAMLVVLAIYVVPSFSKFYTDLDAELPMLTQITLGISFWLRDNGGWLVLGLILLAVGVNAWRQTPGGRVTRRVRRSACAPMPRSWRAGRA